MVRQIESSKASSSDTASAHWMSRRRSTGASGRLLDIWRSGPHDGYAVGYDTSVPESHVVVHYDGTSWSPISAGATENVLGVSGNAVNDTQADGTM